MKTVIRLFVSAVLVSSAFFVSSTMACSTDAWSDATAGARVAAVPLDGIPRVSGECGLEVSGTGYVVDDSPAAETTFIGRFYVLPGNLPAGDNELFVAFSAEGDDTSDVFVVTYNGGSIEVDATAVGGGIVSAAANSSMWNLVEFKWESGADVELWVNKDALTEAADGNAAAGTGAVEQVRLGAVSGIGGVLAYFDDYESHRTLPVGALLAGDGNTDGSVNSGDINVVVNEFLAGNLGNGVVDCNLDGAVNSGDINCIVAIFLNP